ncbi:hypothetical protein VTO73DRAFT_12833 [Trametes versicolor]
MGPRAHPSLLLHNTGEAGIKRLFGKTIFSPTRCPATQDLMTRNCMRQLPRTAPVDLPHVAISQSFASDDPDDIVDPPSSRTPMPMRLPTIDAEALAILIPHPAKFNQVPPAAAMQQASRLDALATEHASLNMEARPYQSFEVINVDIFRLILACVTRADLLKITLASKFTREEAIKELFMRPVRLLQNKNLRLFCEFVLASDPRRLSYLRSLTVEHINKGFSSQDREMVARVLAHCKNLRKLSLEGCDGLVMDEPVVLKAISALPSLAHLSAVMYEDRKESQALLLQMVVNMKSSLCGLHLPMTMDGLSNVEMLRALARVHRHLEDLTLHFRTFIAPGVTFSTVRTLHLTVDKSVPQLRDIRSTFPNIRELSIDLRMYLSATSSTTAGIQNRVNGSCWPSLDLLCAIPTSIRALGIVCPVRRVSLGFSDIDLDEEDTEAVARLCPSKLTLDIRCYHDSVLPGALPSLLLHGSRDAGVKHLFVKTTFARPRGAPPARQVDLLNWILPLLRTARVELLHIAVFKHFESDSDDPQDILDSPVGRSLSGQEVDAEAVAGDVARACVSIRTVAITTALSGHTVWSVDRADGEVRIVKLGAFEGRRLFDQEAKHCLEV